jgi:hypothetical protein
MPELELTDTVRNQSPTDQSIPHNVRCSDVDHKWTRKSVSSRLLLQKGMQACDRPESGPRSNQAFFPQGNLLKFKSDSFQLAIQRLPRLLSRDTS